MATPFDFILGLEPDTSDGTGNQGASTTTQGSYGSMVADTGVTTGDAAHGTPVTAMARVVWYVLCFGVLALGLAKQAGKKIL